MAPMRKHNTNKNRGNKNGTNTRKKKFSSSSSSSLGAGAGNFFGRTTTTSYYRIDYRGVLWFCDNTMHILIVISFSLAVFLICSMGWQHLRLLQRYELLQQQQQHQEHHDHHDHIMDPSFRSIPKGGKSSSIPSSLSDQRPANEESQQPQQHEPHQSMMMRGSSNSGSLEDGIVQKNTAGNENENEADSSSSSSSSTKGKWAYAMLMAGIDPDEENGKWYHGILFNAMVVAENVHRETTNSRHPTSQADVLLMVQFSVNAETHRLTDEEESWLDQAGVKIKYLPIPDHGVQNFYTIQLEKFRILQFTQYSRVLFLDGDVMPYCSLDYLFELSEDGKLKDNMVIAWRSEPSNGGFFMLAPKAGDYEKIVSLVDAHQKKALETGILFDPILGWGHKITSPDQWKTNFNYGTEWRWHGDFVDQGLLYYWVKYYKKNVSILIGDVTEHWIVDTDNPDGAPKSEFWTSKNEPFKSASDKCPCRIGGDDTKLRHSSTTLPIYSKIAPFRDFIHFTGMAKPWTQGNQKNLDILDIVKRVGTTDDDNYDPNQFEHAGEIWQYTFWKLHKRLKLFDDHGDQHDYTDAKGEEQLLKIFTKHLGDIPNALHGGFPTTWHARQVIEAKFGKDASHIGMHEQNGEPLGDAW